MEGDGAVERGAVILGLFLFLVANAAVLLGAHEILRRVRTGSPSLDVVIFLLLRILIISAAVMAGGIAGTLTRGSLGLAGVLALCTLLALGAHRNLPVLRLPKAHPLAWIFAAFVGLRLLLQVWFLAPYSGDTLSYHLPKIAEWVRAGAFTREMGVDSHATFPAGFELFESWWVLFLKHDVFIEMASVEFLLLAFSATYALARNLGLHDSAAFVAALLYVMRPGLQASVASCLNDVAVSALLVATAALILGRVPIGLVLMSIGMGIGIKPVFAYAVPGLVLLGILQRSAPRAAHGSPKVCVVLATMGLLVGGFWYARNAVWFGNPIHPVGAEGLMNSSGRILIQAGPRLWSLVQSLQALIEVRLYDTGSYRAHLDGVSGWGGVAFACGLVALPRSLLTNVGLRRLAGGFAVSALTVLLFVAPDPWNLRFVQFFPAVFCIAVAELARQHRGVAVVAGAAILFEFLATMIPADLSVGDVRSLAGQSWRDRSMADQYRARASGSSVGYLFDEQRGPAYLLYGPDFSRRVVYLRAATADELISTMRKEGLRALYAGPSTPERRAVLRECLESGRLRHQVGGFFARGDETTPK